MLFEMESNSYRDVTHAVLQGVYQHFKGGLYRVLFCAIGADDAINVVYVSLDSGNTYVRSAEDFQKIIESDGRRRQRFELHTPIYVIHSQNFGTYLGYTTKPIDEGKTEFTVHPLWSKAGVKDPGYVPVFHNKEDAENLLHWLHYSRGQVARMRLVQVRPALGIRSDRGTSKEACVAAGLPDWDWFEEQ